MSNSTQKKSASGKKKATAKPQKQQRPIRRELWALALLVLSMFITVSYFGDEAVFVSIVAKLLKGLVGYGYWMTAPALLLAGIILLFHRGRPILLRITCALLLPLIGGALCHMVLSKPVASESIIRDLWNALFVICGTQV